MASPQISRIIKLDETVTLKKYFIHHFRTLFWLSGFHECRGGTVSSVMLIIQKLI